jgi:hypothetical protein
LSPAWKVELELGNKADLLEIGKKAMSDKKVGNTNASDEETTLSQNDKLVLPPVNTRIEIARAAGVSTGQVGMAEQEIPNCYQELSQLEKRSRCY